MYVMKLFISVDVIRKARTHVRVTRKNAFISMEIFEGILREIGNVFHLVLWRTFLPNAFLPTFHAYLTMMSKYNYLTTRSTVLLEKLLASQVVKNFPAFYGT